MKEKLSWKKTRKKGKNRCIACGGCIGVCPKSALRFNKSHDKIIIDHSKCTSCGACINACPESILKMVKK